MDANSSSVPTSVQPAAQSATNSAPNGEISQDEIALYDRQIRLWGIDAQEKIRHAKVLLVGIRALGNEIAKNLALAGIGSLTLVDDDILSEDDLGAQFLVTQEDVGRKTRAEAALPQIQRLNPRVNLAITTLGIIFGDPTIFSNYSIVIGTDLPLSGLSNINAACRVASRPFYAAGSFGLFGFIFADIISHTFVISREKSNVPTQPGPETPTRTIVVASTSRTSDGKVVELVTKREMYTPLLLANTSFLPPYNLASRRRKFAVSPILACIRAVWEYQALMNGAYPSDSSADRELFITIATNKHHELTLPAETLRADIIRNFLQNIGTEISPVCAYLGGQLAQDVINVLSEKEQPIQNMLIFDGEESKGPIYALHTDMQPILGNESAVGNSLAELPPNTAPQMPSSADTGPAMPPSVTGTASAAAPSMAPATTASAGGNEQGVPGTVQGSNSSPTSNPQR